MKKRAASLALVLSMILSFTCQAGAVDAKTETQLDAVKSILEDAGMQEKQFPNGDSDYIQMAKSLTIIGDNFKADAECTADEKAAMQSKATQIGLKNAIENGEPLFVGGVAQPIFPYTSGVPTKDGYSNDNSDIIRYSVYVETNYDTDGDGKLDLVKALVQLPRAAAEGKYKAAAIYDARPYITGCTDNGEARGIDYTKGDQKYNLNDLYVQPAAREAQGTANTMDTAKKAKAEEWYYLSPYESSPGDPFYDYEDLDWYDYFLVRGYAAIEVGGLGTRGSEGLETCGADVETDAFKCVIEWLTGDRAAYTDRTSNIAIKADWSNGNVAMTGRSYGGTTDFAVASTGVKGLKTIVPVAGIASWYDYTNSQGISTHTNPAYSDDLGFYCAGRYIDENDWNSMKDVYQKYLNRIYNDQMTLNGDYGTHWATRDYTAGNEGKAGTASTSKYNNFNCPALIVHGLNDDNVRTKQFQLMYDAFKNAKQNVKLLLHQGEHITPDYDDHKTSLMIGNKTYSSILNEWYSHYLYGQNTNDGNNAEAMAAVTVQNNTDGSWSTLDSWPTSDSLADVNNKLTLTNTATGTTTINSNMNGISNWRDAFTSSSTSASAMYATEPVANDTVIKGTVQVKISAAPIQHPDQQASATAVQSESTGSRDALMMSAMLVDVADDEFTTYPMSRTEVKTGKMNWVGSGAQDYEIINFKTVQSKYKIIARGWIDLANPSAGFDSASAANKISLEDGVYHDYTVYLQPNYYTVKAGHKLALVVYTYEPGKASYSENYGITIDNHSLSAVIPVPKGTSAATMSAIGKKYNWYADAVKYVTDKGLMNGTDDNQFSPSATTTRAMLMTVLARYAGEDTTGGATWYEKGMNWAKAKGVSDGTNPNANITREQLVTMMYRYAGSPKADGKLDSFSDAASVSTYAADAMQWAVANGIVNGSNGKLNPQNNATRAQVAAILMRFCEMSK
ncbi:CocE/NonD family hydrolase [Agathobaculum butyriciproducens]|uniref:Xaa-Pro dipeptidyl-peptidase n=1 Tax=Agathobaculum butyriciproducens TaxID=1628085 RepID=A0AAW4W3R5_9FIRM|nr:S-layer homology domain-containing protein [Agathobaculum butyriciproducens]